jgi:hypothetical protein
MQEKTLSILNLGLLELAKSKKLFKEDVLKIMSPKEIYDNILSDEMLRSIILAGDLEYSASKYIEQLVLSYQEKKISSITNTDILHSIYSKELKRMPSSEMKIVFDAMKNNYEIYRKLYQYKMYCVTTTLDDKYLINITGSKLLHLLGMSFMNWQKYYRREIVELIPELKELINISYKNACMNQTDDLLEVLRIVINKEERIINAILEYDHFAKAFPMHKMKTKNFAFERLGLIESPAGIVLYQKELNNSQKTSFLNSDIFILRDFIRDFKLEWIFNGYAPYKTDIRDAETLLIEPDSSEKFDGQEISISTGVQSLNKSNFDHHVFCIEDEDLVNKVTSYDVVFKEEDVIVEAEKIIEYYSTAKINHLKDIIERGFQKIR